MALAGMPGLMATKYQILGQHAQAAQTTAQAAAQEAAARSGYYGALTKAEPMEAEARAREAAARGGLYGAQAEESRGLLPYRERELGVGDQFVDTSGLGLKKGTSMVGAENDKTGKNRVPGKGDGKTDTQPAMLAPGEAVLNKAAEEHLGRDTIALLNAIGAHKMNLDASGISGQSAPQPDMGQGSPGSANPSGAPGYQFGTKNVQRTDWGPPVPIAAPAPAGPGPGQMQTTGNWGKPVGQNQDLRARLIQKPQEFAAGTEDVGGSQTGYAKGTTQVSKQKPNMGDVRDRSQVPQPGPMYSSPASFAEGGIVLGLAGGTKSVPDPGSDVQDRWNTGLPMFAAGSPDVSGGDGRGSLTPHILAALMAIGGGGGAPGMGMAGGGMPPPGAMQPMPMPMPQVAQRGSSKSAAPKKTESKKTESKPPAKKAA